MRHLTGYRRFWIAPLVLGGLALIVLITMFLWNSLMPGIFNLPEIKYWQAAGLLVLFRLLFGFGHHWRGYGYYRGKHLREKWEKMSPEEREKFREHMRHHHYCPDEFRDEQSNPETK